MFGKYAATAFELEAERRREVAAETMRDARRNLRRADDERLEGERGNPPNGLGLATLAGTLLARMVRLT